MTDEWDEKYLQSKLLVDLSKYRIKDSSKLHDNASGHAINKSSHSNPTSVKDRFSRNDRRSSWTCKICTAIVYGARLNCFYCKQPKYAAENEVDKKSQSGWTCVNCNAFVFGFRTVCYKCRASKDGQCLEEMKVKSFIRATDWKCHQCRSFVYGAHSCYKCGSARKMIE